MKIEKTLTTGSTSVVDIGLLVNSNEIKGSIEVSLLNNLSSSATITMKKKVRFFENQQELESEVISLSANQFKNVVIESEPLFDIFEFTGPGTIDVSIQVRAI